ncbi:MAG: FadR/GntR family transcriptional regulator [Lachnospiraceae bacterium]|nr:FadR/GntR family transcriptional regulator [Lachnospiraceae bacterium]
MAKSEKMLSERIAEKIFNMIASEKRFSPGEKIPNEMNFSFELGVSRTTLREAVKILAAHGVLETKRGKGTYVTANMDFSNEKISLESSYRSKLDFNDLIELRLILEPRIARFAAERCTKDDIQKIKAASKKVVKNIKNNENRRASEEEFHSAIARATGNEFMSLLLPIIFRGILGGSETFLDKDYINFHTIEDHEKIVKYIEEGSGDGAFSAMKIHLAHSIAGINRDMTKNS